MLTRIALKFRVITLLILALVIASGVWSASKLQLELLPDVEFPLFTVFTYYEDGAKLRKLDNFIFSTDSSWYRKKYANKIDTIINQWLII